MKPGGLFENSQHGLCGYHLVDRALINHPVGRPGGKKNQELFNQVIRYYKDWVYSWMRAVETEPEYETSKSLLFEWLQGEDVSDIAGTKIVQNLVEFTHKHLLPYIRKALKCLRLKIRSFDEFVNSISEIEAGWHKQNNTVMPYMPLAMTVQNIREKVEDRMNTKLYTDYRSSTSMPLWSESETRQVVTTYAEGLLMLQYQLAIRLHYSVVRLSAHK